MTDKSKFIGDPSLPELDMLSKVIGSVLALNAEYRVQISVDVNDVTVSVLTPDEEIVAEDSVEIASEYPGREEWSQHLMESVLEARKQLPEMSQLPGIN